MIILYDNYDSFTYNLLHYLQQYNLEVRVIRNDEKNTAEIAALNPRGVVLSPGPGRPEKSGGLMELIAHFHNKCPVLGVCLGHQALGCYFGARLVHAAVPMHGKTSMVYHTDHPSFGGEKGETEVMRYHSLLLEEAHSPAWALTARTEQGEIMPMSHKSIQQWAIHFL